MRLERRKKRSDPYGVALGMLIDSPTEIFEDALKAFSGDRSFVRLYTRLQFKECTKMRCLRTLGLTSYYGWKKMPPTPWRRYTKGENPAMEAYLGASDAAEHTADALSEHVHEVLGGSGGGEE